MIWKDPTTPDEWTELFKQVQSDFDKIEIPDVMSIQPGEVLEPSEINVEIVKTAKAFRETGSIKDRARRLEAIAKRWYEQVKARAVLELRSAANREIYSSDELRKAYAEDQAAAVRGLWDASRVLAASIKDERQRIYQYRKDLENIGNNARWTPRA
jgi:hypothetical protein